MNKGPIQSTSIVVPPSGPLLSFPGTPSTSPCWLVSSPSMQWYCGQRVFIISDINLARPLSPLTQSSTEGTETMAMTKPRCYTVLMLLFVKAIHCCPAREAPQGEWCQGVLNCCHCHCHWSYSFTVPYAHLWYHYGWMCCDNHWLSKQAILYHQIYLPPLSSWSWDIPWWCLLPLLTLAQACSNDEQ